MIKRGGKGRYLIPNTLNRVTLTRPVGKIFHQWVSTVFFLYTHDTSRFQGFSTTKVPLTVGFPKTQYTRFEMYD